MAERNRIDALDVLRGIAILGTLGTNIWIFTDPGGILGFLSRQTGTGSVGEAVELVLRYVANGKFLGLLTLLFGVGIELQYRSARRKGERWPGWYLWRAALLLCEGALHFVLVFEGDVLMAYALTSFVVAYLVARSDRAVRAIMIMVGGLQVALISMGTTALITQASSLGFGVPSANPDVFASRSYLDQVLVRVDNALFYRSETIFVLPSAVVLFLLGSRLVRAGVFSDSAQGQRLRTRLVLLGLGVAAPLNLATALAGQGWILVDRYLLPPFVALGLLGLVTTVLLDARGEPGRCRRALAAVGRTALSCYVLQNVLASVLCYGWGLGLASRMAGWRPWWVIGIWAGICLTFTILASWWLRRFDRGPLELVMHRLYQAPRRWFTAPRVKVRQFG